MATDKTAPTYAEAPYVEPKPSGYLYLGLRVDPPTRTPFVRTSKAREDVVQEYKEHARSLQAHPQVAAATVYEAVLIPPLKNSPRFDVMALIETTTPEACAALQAEDAYRRLDPEFCMRARNIRRTGDVDAAPRSGPFLFNHFTAPDPDTALSTFDAVAGWFTTRAGTRDSALLQPTGECPYVFVNHVRLPCAPARFLLRLARPSFRTHVAAALKARQVGNAPVFCTPA